MNLVTFSRQVAHNLSNTGISKKDAEMYVRSILATMSEELSRGEVLDFKGYFKLYTEKVESQERKLPDGTVTTIPAHRKIKFKPSKNLKESVK